MVVRTLKLAPSRALSSFVSYLRVSELEPAVRVPYLRLPDGQLELTIRLDAHSPALRVVGTRMRALSKPSDAAPAFVVVRFKPGGAYPFFGLPVGELTDQLVDLEEFWKADAAALAARLHRSASREQHLEAVEGALLGRLGARAYEPASVPSVRRALRRIAAAQTLPSVDALAGELGASTRQLRRAFVEVVGIGPKQYLRVTRFQRAFAAVRRMPEASLATIARLAGYSDQSHLNAEFRELAAHPPSAFRRPTAHGRAAF